MSNTSIDAIRFLINGKDIVNFSSFNYLALTTEPSILRAGEAALHNESALGRIPAYFLGKQPFYAEAEDEAKKFFSCNEETEVMYTSVGYMFGLIALQGLSDEFDVAFLDAHAHYNLFDGIKSVDKPYYVFDHLSAESLESLLSEKLQPGQIPLVITDGVFPTTCHVPPLDVYKKLSDRYNGWILVDESHSFGVLGNARGTIHEYGLESSDRIVYGGSSSKGFAAYGGLLIGPPEIVAKMRASHAAIGTNPGISSGAAMTATALRYIDSHPEINTKLRMNIERLNLALANAGFNGIETFSAGATFYIGDLEYKKSIQKQLASQGYFIACCSITIDVRHQG